MKQTLEPVLSKTLMNYEAKGIYWQSASEDRIQTMAPYHCNFMGCGVRYDHMNGYFTVLNVPERPFLWKSQAQALNVQGMVRGCTYVKMSKATPVLRGGAASRDATTCTQTSADCESSRGRKQCCPRQDIINQRASVEGKWLTVRHGQEGEEKMKKRMSRNSSEKEQRRARRGKRDHRKHSSQTKQAMETSVPNMMQSGGPQGTACTKALTSESIAELFEEGQDLETELVLGVENTPDADQSKIRTHPASREEAPEYRNRNRI